MDISMVFHYSKNARKAYTLSCACMRSPVSLIVEQRGWVIEVLVV